MRLNLRVALLARLQEDEVVDAADIVDAARVNQPHERVVTDLMERIRGTG
jgi:hypothetical protein